VLTNKNIFLSCACGVQWQTGHINERFQEDASQSISKERCSPLLPLLLPHPVMCLGLELPLNAHRKISKCEERNFRRVSSTREEYNGEEENKFLYLS
jgi:hypothetical protein